MPDGWGGRGVTTAMRGAVDNDAGRRSLKLWRAPAQKRRRPVPAEFGVLVGNDGVPEPGSASPRSKASRIESIDSGSNRAGSKGCTSLRLEESAQSTGTPHRMASSAGSPNPSYNDGKMERVAC